MLDSISLAKAWPILGLLILLVGCRSTSEITDEDVPRDIAWLTSELHKDGIFVAEKGEAEINVTANVSRRLRLNGRETVDAYYFDEAERAAAQATIYSSYNPRASVYQIETLVVVRYSDQMSEISSALTEHMGATI